MHFRLNTDPATRREVSVLALGAMLFGSRTDARTSFAVPGRCAEAVGARPPAPGTGCTDDAEGLSAKVIRESADRSRERLGVERARALAAAAGLPGYEALQYQHSHLRPRTDMPSELFPDGSLGAADAQLRSCPRAEPELTLVAYSPLLTGAYSRAGKPLPPDYDHPGTPARLAALREVARETGAAVNAGLAAGR
ncbi:hypothetical protein GCM10017687_78120 [Streptomyces echinatus]|uniref:Aryl-alcohol dehydrogenase-like predicted oxidoreductase n=1 Tax=Streptomyces echinatus TaxID=67293 RepID=A0A7W9PYN1_9ACTN|nr:aryl-alcohol dehydrogenase-like predicted oxidoreductase [Streptomyces echinatus]